MKRSERHHALLDHLRARAPRPVSAARLAEEFDVSSRTIERDLAALMAARVPLYAVGGRTGGYTVMTTYSLPPLNLGVDEALACAVALDLLAESPFRGPAMRARDRIVAALPPSVRDAARAGAVPVERVRSGVGGSPDLGVLPLAIATRTVVRLTYRGGAEREVEPLRLLHGAGGWYLIVWERPAGGVRGFRVDRIDGLARTDVTFTDLHRREVGADLARWTRAPVDDLT